MISALKKINDTDIYRGAGSRGGGGRDLGRGRGRGNQRGNYEGIIAKEYFENNFLNLEQFGRPRSRVTQECGELCQLRWKFRITYFF